MFIAGRSNSGFAAVLWQAKQFLLDSSVNVSMVVFETRTEAVVLCWIAGPDKPGSRRLPLQCRVSGDLQETLPSNPAISPAKINYAIAIETIPFKRQLGESSC